jgi:hypothetical protein
MTVVRISHGRFDPAKMDEAEQLLIDSEPALREPLQQLRGLVHYYVGIDREQGFLTNVSVWETLEDAHQMDSLQAMLDQRPILQAAGISFEPITNHDTVWTISPERSCDGTSASAQSGLVASSGPAHVQRC